MLSVWRLLKARYAQRPLSGDGARRFGGRWSSPGTAVVYSSGSVALAALEVLVHLADPSAFEGFVLARIDVHVEPARIADLPALPLTWKRTPPDRLAQQVGDDWVRARKSLLVRVPSAVVPYEHNYLLNPSHPDMKRVRVGLKERFAFDRRLAR